MLIGRARAHALVRGASLAGAALVLSACGDGDGSATQTTLRLTPTNYVTVPPTPTTTTTTTVPGQPADPNAPAVTNPGEQTYTVQQGDYPLRVAKLFGITLEQLAAHNGWADPLKVSNAQFYAGLVIKIPAGAAVPTSAPPTSAGQVSAPAATSGPTSSTIDTAGQGRYTIKEGDVPVRVAQSFDVTLEQLATANGWASTTPTNAEFQVGKTIVIPAKTG